MKPYKDRSSADPTKAPRVMIAGPLLDGEPNVYDGSSPQRPELSVGLDDVASATQEALDLIDQDVDLLKAYEMLTPEQFVAICKVASKKGLNVTGHVP